jgi:hypothetical protein
MNKHGDNVNAFLLEVTSNCPQAATGADTSIHDYRRHNCPEREIKNHLEEEPERLQGQARLAKVQTTNFG